MLRELRQVLESIRPTEDPIHIARLERFVEDIQRDKVKVWPKWTVVYVGPYQGLAWAFFLNHDDAAQFYDNLDHKVILRPFHRPTDASKMV